jgi:hypothetical protein
VDNVSFVNERNDNFSFGNIKLQPNTYNQKSFGAVPWRKPLVAGPSTRRLGLADSADHVGFVVDKVAKGQVSLRVLSVFALLLSPYQCAVLNVLFICHRNYKILARDFVK